MVFVKQIVERNVHTLDDGHDGTLLDSRRALETVGIDAAKQLGLQVHLIERVDGLIVVRLDLSCRLKPCQRTFSEKSDSGARR